MLWVKAFHIVFMVTWFAGLFYLPRLFVYHAEMPTDDRTGHARFLVMERRLLGITHIGAGLTALFGLWLLLAYRSDLLHAGWFHTKMLIVVGLITYHAFCVRLVAQFRNGQNIHSSRWYRLFNEVPALALVGAVVLAVVKPF